jgi:hypothetical protein
MQVRQGHEWVGEWTVEVEAAAKATDAQGWMYGSSFGELEVDLEHGRPRGVPKTFDSFRRRRWVRKSHPIPVAAIAPPERQAASDAATVIQRRVRRRQARATPWSKGQTTGENAATHTVEEVQGAAGTTIGSEDADAVDPGWNIMEGGVMAAKQDAEVASAANSPSPTAKGAVGSTSEGGNWWDVSTWGGDGKENNGGGSSPTKPERKKPPPPKKPLRRGSATVAIATTEDGLPAEEVELPPTVIIAVSGPWLRVALPKGSMGNLFAALDRKDIRENLQFLFEETIGPSVVEAVASQLGDMTAAVMRFSMIHSTKFTYDEDDEEWVIMSTCSIPSISGGVKREQLSAQAVKKAIGKLGVKGKMPSFSSFDDVLAKTFVRAVVECDGGISVEIPQWIKVRCHVVTQAPSTRYSCP